MTKDNTNRVKVGGYYGQVFTHGGENIIVGCNQEFVIINTPQQHKFSSLEEAYAFLIKKDKQTYAQLPIKSDKLHALHKLIWEL